MILNALWAVFPATLLVLLLALVGREIFDRTRVRAANRRRLVAIKAVVGDELGRNVATAGALGQALHRIGDGLDHACDIRLSSQADALEVRTSSPAGGQGTVTLVLPVRRQAIDRFVLDA